MQTYQCRRVKDVEIDRAIELLFTDRGSSRQQSHQQILSFQQLAQLDHYDLLRQMVIENKGQLVHAACFVPNEGGTVFVFLSSPDRLPRERETLDPYCRDMLRELIRWSFNEGAKLLQVLIEPEDKSRRQLCLACGFSYLTDLVYLYCSSRPSPLVDAPPPNVHWVGYDVSTHELFKRVIAQTYQESLDCPELENMRDMEDVIRAHKASGVFDRKFWNVLFVKDQPAGVLLLSPLRNSDMMELTYMGLGREYRGQKLGLILLSQAMRSVGQSGLAGLTLAVDQRNHPASHLYARFGFTELFRRSALICNAPSV